MTTSSTAAQISFRQNKFLQRLALLLPAVMVASFYDCNMVEDWRLENILVVVLVGLLAATYRKFVFSDLSYLLIFLFLCMHEWGAHHKYADVPLGEWLKPILHTQRNHYDRIVHFAFGLLFAYPVREIAVRVMKIRRPWDIYIPIEFSLAFGAAYEIIEAIVASIVSPEAGDAFLGLQGDQWDTQKDMFDAFAGALIAMSVTAFFVWRKISVPRMA